MHILSTFLLAIIPLIAAQDVHSSPESTSPSSSSSSIEAQCKFSCPPRNTLSWSLVKRKHAVGWDSYYTLFECVYAVPEKDSDLSISEWKCSYDKRTGHQTLSAAGDNCPPEAIPCPSFSAGQDIAQAQMPMFSNFAKDEIPPWVENGRFLLWLKEHQPE